MEEQVVTRVFEISPTTVYGVLCMLLVISNAWFIHRNKQLTDKLIEMNSSGLITLNDLSRGLENHKNIIDNLSLRFTEQFTNFREHISLIINQKSNKNE